MENNWPTKNQDIALAQQIIEEYAEQHKSLGLFEIVVNHHQKQMNFRLSDWVTVLAKQFNSLYGITQGDFVIRKIVSRCLMNGQVLH